MNYWVVAVWVALVDLLLCVFASIFPQVHPLDPTKGYHINAEYVVTAEWSTDVDADVDLWVGVPPAGDPVYYGRTAMNNVTLDYDNKGWTDSVTHLPDGTVVRAPIAKEMTTIRGKVPGTFDVAVFLYSFRRDNVSADERDRTLDVKVHVEVVQLNPSTKVVFQKDVVLTHVRQDINVVSFELDREGNISLRPTALEPVTHTVYSAGSVVQ